VVVERRSVVIRLVKYSTVSGIGTAVSMLTLGVLVATDSMTPGWANVAGISLGAIPSYELNRRWVWGKQGKRSVWGQIVPFFLLALFGLVLSTALVHVAAQLTAPMGLDRASQALVAEAASLSAFIVRWVGQYFVLDRLLFR
jgi:putative flippase GtrA